MSYGIFLNNVIFCVTLRTWDIRYNISTKSFLKVR